MKYKVIGTGSSGNALLLENGVLVDCGVGYKELAGEVIGLVLLTHRHSDHFKIPTIKKLAQDHPMVRFACPGYLAEDLVKECKVQTKRVDIIEEGETYDYGLASIRSFPLEHDVPNVGWIIEINSESVLYMTDTGTTDHLTGSEFNGLDYYFIEANYDEQELEERMRKKFEAGEFAYESRVKRTHLSRQQADEFVSFYARDDSKVINLHRHEEKKEKKVHEEADPPSLMGLLHPVDIKEETYQSGEDERIRKDTQTDSEVGMV